MQHRVVALLGKGPQGGQRAGGDLVGQRGQRRQHGVGRGAKVSVADSGAIDAALARDVDQLPSRKRTQVAAGGILEVADQHQRLAGNGRKIPRQPLPDAFNQRAIKLHMRRRLGASAPARPIP